MYLLIQPRPPRTSLLTSRMNKTRMPPNTTIFLLVSCLRSTFMGKPIDKLWGSNSIFTPPHYDHSSRTIWRLGGVSGRMTIISHHNKWGKCTWRSTKTSSIQVGGPTRTPRILRSWLYLEWIKILQMTQRNHQINPTCIQQRYIQLTSGTYHPVCWKSQKGGGGKKNNDRKNIGGARNTALAKANGPTTSQKITGRNQYLVEQCRKQCAIKRGRQQQEADHHQGLQGSPYSSQEPKVCTSLPAPV